MAKKDPRVDAYIEEAAAFAQPILKHLRKIVHKGCSEVEETIKWQFPHFDYKGILCAMAAFKEHCAFGFWKGSLIFPKRRDDQKGMGQFGRITSIADLPDEMILIKYVRKAAQLNEAGVKTPAPKKRKPLKVPSDFSAALSRNAKARKAFESFSPSAKRDYIEWVSEAKRDETRRERLSTSIAWLAEGKPRNWKYLPKSR